MTFTAPSESDYAYLDHLEQMRSASRVVATTATPLTAANLVGIARQYPGISPGLAYAFAASNQPGVADAYQAELASRLNSQPGTQRNVQKQAVKQASTDQLVQALAANPDNLPHDLERALNAQLQGMSDKQIADLADSAGFTGKNKYGRSGVDELKVIRNTDPSRWQPKQPDPGVLGFAAKAVAPIANVVNTAMNNAEAGQQNMPTRIPGLPSTREVVRGAALGAQAGLEGVVATGRELAPGVGINIPGLNNATGTVPVVSTQTPGQFVSSIAQQTTLGQTAMGNSAGQGWLPNPNSAAGQAQAEAARKFSPYLVGGHAWTPGRAVAGTVFEPDSDAFNISSGLIDTGVAIYADPANIGLVKLAEARAAGKLLVPDDALTAARESAGVFAGIRSRFEPQRFTEWVNTRGARVMDAIAAESDPWTIHHATGIPYVTLDGEHLVDKLAHATTANDVAELIKPYAGIDNAFRQTFNYQTPGYGSRLLSNVPGQKIPIGENADINEAARQSDLALVNSRASLDDRKAVAKLWASADTRSQHYGAVDKTFDVIEKQLTLNGVPEELAHDLTRFEKNDFRDLTNYGHDWSGEQLINQHLNIEGELHPLPHPIFDNQELNSAVQLPNAREIRRLTSPYADVFNAGLVKDAVALGDLAMVPWRRLMLMRPAWGVRVVAEEQLRMAAEGFDSLLSAHPLRAIAYAIGSPEDRWITKLEEMGGRAKEALRSGEQPLDRDLIAGAVGRVARDVKARVGKGVGSTFSTVESDPFMQAQYLKGPRRFSAVYDETPRVYMDQFGLTRKGDKLYPQAIAEEIVRMRESHVARAAVDASDPQVLKDAFWDGPLTNVRKYMADDPKLAVMGGTDNAARLAADAQMDIAYQAINTVTANGNPTLVDAMRTGTIGGTEISDGAGGISKNALAKIQDLIDSGADVPDKMRIRKFLTLNETQQKAFTRKLGKATDSLFNALMPRPSDYLSRSPTFKQYYWNRLAETVPYMDEATRARAIEEVGVANLARDPAGRKIIEMNDKLTAMGEHAPTPAITDFAVADNVAKHYALHQTKELLYDLSNRSQISDVGRLIAPFSEAWKEIVTRWAKIAYENPHVLRRVAQAAWEVQQPGSKSLNEAFGDTVPNHGGFFYKNNFGEEVFAYPGSELITKATLGMPIPLTGNVSGLNLVSQGLPGIGPLVQVPLSYLLPDKPQTDWIANQLFPYGRSTGNPLGAALDAYTPAWAKRAIASLNSPDSDRLFANTVFDVARYKASTGEYDIQGPNAQSEMNRLLTDSKQAARGVYVIRALGSLTLPTAPSPEWLTTDKKGKLTLAWRVADWYQKEVKKTGSTTDAMDSFLNKFGVDNILLAQSHSKTVVPAAPTTTDAAAWYRAHPDLATKYPITYGLFAPTSGGFDDATYTAQFERGERRQLRPEEMLRLANARLGNYLYTKAKDNGADAVSLRQLRQQITDEFPGYQTGSPIQSYKREDVISELQRTVKDPAIRNTPAGRALRYYFEERQLAVDKSTSAGLASPWGAARALPLRNALRAYGETLVHQYPSFQPLWDGVFSREVGNA